MQNEEKHKAGFVSIIGKPNVGKSTLMNALVGEKLSIATPKAQTTRHRVTGILNGEDYQIIYQDTPGILEPKYELHKRMMHYVQQALEDADILLIVVEPHEQWEESALLDYLTHTAQPIIVAINKADTSEQAKLAQAVAYWESRLPNAKAVIPVSALYHFNLDTLLSALLSYLPEHPPYFDKEQISDQSERFFAAEIIREKIFLLYREEIPYSCDVQIFSFKEKEHIIHIQADIIVERESQRKILIGKGGSALKQVGVAARKELEAFLGKKVYLELHVKVIKNWRRQERWLERLGYKKP
jgi:GTP-binding protein Era